MSTRRDYFAAKLNEWWRGPARFGVTLPDALADELDAWLVEWERNREPSEAELTAIMEVIGHYACEDCWYSCPRSAEGCCDDKAGDACNCGLEKQSIAVWVAARDVRISESTERAWELSDGTPLEMGDFTKVTWTDESTERAGESAE